MESEKLYRRIFYAGCGWNVLVSVPMVFLVESLPDMLHIDAPRYPVFIYFNLMTVFLFGCLQFTVAQHLETARPYVKILAWSKILLVLVFLAAVFLLAMPEALAEFLAPGMAVDLVFGLLFWRYLRFSARKTAVPPS
jgi:hypothetical protein